MAYSLERLAFCKKALLVGIQWPKESGEEARVLLDELKELVLTLGVSIGGETLVTLRKPAANFLLGRGKVEVIVERVKMEGFDLVVFDDELSPAQQRNWEKATGARVVDRQEVILDIFSGRAQTKEATLQVELACLEYALPRLKRAWAHLSRQRGGRVMQRGMGEKQIEVDERLVRTRVAQLKAMLARIVKQRGVQRKRRLRVPVPTAAIVGYTNAGKSLLLNCLTGSGALVEDKLFATLDPLTRRLTLPSGQVLLATDTVGFVRRLPHRLVEAFKATLEETIVADFLIHVVDVSHSGIQERVATTQRVLKELGADMKKIIMVFNKVDLVDERGRRELLRVQFPKDCFVSAKTGEGIELLLTKIEEMLEDAVVPMELLIPYDEYGWVNRLHEWGAVREEESMDAGVYVVVNVPVRFKEAVQRFLYKKT